MKFSEKGNCLSGGSTVLRTEPDTKQYAEPNSNIGTEPYADTLQHKDSHIKIYQNTDNIIIISPIRSYEENLEFLTESERNYLNSYGSQARRAAGSTWRAVLRSHTGCGETYYSADGAPLIKDSGLHISISHTSDKVAVMVSEKCCGIDIEKCDRNFKRISGRYMNCSETLIPNPFGELWNGVVWCAKEAMYKMAGLRGLDFKRDMTVMKVTGNTLTCNVFTPTGNTKQFVLEAMKDDEHLCVWGTI